jgi:undecaprenyl diphosphate synthase
MNPVKHVAIIMDGNGRWGLQQKNSRNFGHRAGLKPVEAVINESLKAKIQHLTLFTFSTENWKRPKKEISFLFNLLEKFLVLKLDDLIRNGIKLKILGDKKLFSKKLREIIRKTEQKTSKNNKLQINLALNYGAKNEIVNAIRIIVKNKYKLTLKNIENNLYTKGIPDPDILIRTGNTRRLSNFLLWQLAYTEIFFEKKLWPDFSAKDFKKILYKFKDLKRNFGAI